MIVPSTLDMAETATSLAPSTTRVEVAEVEGEVVGHGQVAQLDVALLA